MARSISVKVPTSSLIESIEARIAEIEEAEKAYPVLREQYEQAQVRYKELVIEFLADFLTSNNHSVGYDYEDTIRISRAYNGRFELVLDTDAIAGFPVEPTAPEKPNQKEWFGRDHQTRKQLLEKNLKILKMTSQEEVNASTYGAIMELL